MGHVFRDLRKFLPNLPDLPGRKPTNLPGSIGELFKGREKFLTKIQDTLKSSPGAAITQTLAGLGGIGKTRLAIEFDHVDDYTALLFLSADSSNNVKSPRMVRSTCHAISRQRCDDLANQF